MERLSQLPSRLNSPVLKIRSIMSGGTVIRGVVLALCFIACIVITTRAATTEREHKELYFLHFFLRLFSICVSISAFTHVSFWGEQFDILHKLGLKFNDGTLGDQQFHNIWTLRAFNLKNKFFKSGTVFNVIMCMLIIFTAQIWYIVSCFHDGSLKCASDFFIDIFGTVLLCCICWFILCIRNKYKILRKVCYLDESGSILMPRDEQWLEGRVKDLRKLNRIVGRVNKKIDLALLSCVSQLYVSTLLYALAIFKNYGQEEDFSNILPLILRLVSAVGTFLLLTYSCHSLTRSADKVTSAMHTGMSFHQHQPVTVKICGMFCVDLRFFYHFMRGVILLTVLPHLVANGVKQLVQECVTGIRGT